MWNFCKIGRFVALDVLLHWTFCCIGRFVVLVVMFWPFCNIGCFDFGRFVPILKEGG